jgi:hypothetical protein
VLDGKRTKGLLVPRVLVPGVALAFVLIGTIEGAATQAVRAGIGAMLVGIVTWLVTRDLFLRRRVDTETV